MRSRCEFLADQELRLRGFDSFLPLRRVRRRWSDRIKLLDEPIFPGYLFCRFEFPERVRVLNAPGVAHILGAGAVPIPISESEVRSVQAMVASEVALTPWPYLEVGRKVLLDRGPLAGVEGIVARAEDGKSRVVVTVTLLRRSVAAEVDRDWIEM